MDKELQDIVSSDEAYVQAIQKFAAERGDECTIVSKPDTYGNWILGIQTHDGHPLSITLNYTP